MTSAVSRFGLPDDPRAQRKASSFPAVGTLGRRPDFSSKYFVYPVLDKTLGRVTGGGERFGLCE